MQMKTTTYRALPARNERQRSRPRFGFGGIPERLTAEKVAHGGGGRDIDPEPVQLAGDANIAPAAVVVCEPQNRLAHLALDGKAGRAVGAANV
jgi:hypothetical protein